MLGLNDLKECPKLQHDGVWVEVRFGMEFKVRRIGTQQASEALKAIHKDMFKSKTELTSWDLNHAHAVWLRDYGVVDWRGVKDTNGDELPCTPINREALVDEGVRLTLVQWLIAECDSWENFLALQTQENIEAVKKPLAGTLTR